MTDREKLIELLTAPCRKHTHCSEDYCKSNKGHCQSDFADHLIFHGVTFAKDTDVPSKWISAEERLPKNFSLVMAYEPDYGVGEAEFEHGKFHWASNEDLAFVTHWMPLPQPPREQKGENET